MSVACDERGSAVGEEGFSVCLGRGVWPGSQHSSSPSAVLTPADSVGTGLEIYQISSDPGVSVVGRAVILCTSQEGKGKPMPECNQGASW